MSFEIQFRRRCVHLGRFCKVGDILGLKPNNGGWDYYYSFGSPLVVRADDLTIFWSDFEYDADQEKLEKAKKAARDGSY